MRDLVTNLTQPFRLMYEFCIRLWVWLPILWKDRDWDHAHLLEMLRFKLSRMRHHHENFSHTTPEYTNRTIKQLRTCELLLERLINDDYAQHLVPPYEPFGQRITDERAAEWKIYLKEERRARAADEAYLFNYMRKYYRHWWD